MLNYLLSVTPVNLGAYMLATWLGMMPITFAFVYVGTTLKDLSDVTHGWSDVSTTRLVYIGLGLLVSDTQGNTEFEIPEICIESTQSPDSKWKLGLVELANTHFTSICVENIENKTTPMALKVWKTVPFVEDVCMSQTASVGTIAGSVKQLS